MYYPYFRGKQNELAAIRETAQIMAAVKFVPVIEPVKASLSALNRTLAAVCAANGRAIVVVNPQHGDHRQNGMPITRLLANYLDTPAISAGILLSSHIGLDEVQATIALHRNRIVYIHCGFLRPEELAQSLGPTLADTVHVFFEAKCGAAYRQHFKGATQILIRDGFSDAERNADYPPKEHFSELHKTFQSKYNQNGFGDFATVGDRYSERGGPAYAVAIHLTYLEPKMDNEMYIHHFKSDTNDTQGNTGGKFSQALSKLINSVNEHGSPIIETSAIVQFRDCYVKGHFPGLGIVKKLSLKHHIETLADYFHRLG